MAEKSKYDSFRRATKQNNELCSYNDGIGWHLKVTESSAPGFVDEPKKRVHNLITKSEFSYKRTDLHLIISQVIWGEGVLSSVRGGFSP